MRLIDADKLDWWYKGRPIRRIIDEAPTIDAVPVVRCKDCKFYGCFFSDSFCDRIETPMSPDDFCSCGERRTNE